RVYARSLIEPGEKTKIIIIETSEFVNEIKEKLGVLFNYNIDNFVLSSGGIILQENIKIVDYNLDDDDEIALIPSRKEKK
ncbi:MAG: ubiquitin-like domain-containing protein, partial [Promethearchaeota archaeon]